MSSKYPQNIPMLCQIIATLNSYSNKQKCKDPCCNRLCQISPNQTLFIQSQVSLIFCIFKNTSVTCFKELITNYYPLSVCNINPLSKHMMLFYLSEPRVPSCCLCPLLMLRCPGQRPGDSAAPRTCPSCARGPGRRSPGVGPGRSAGAGWGATCPPAVSRA